jgi:tRNA(adenine34) deaminase
MRKSLSLAERAAAMGEVPVGAVVVCGGKIIARGHNRRETKATPLGHAEIEAIRKASKKLKRWRLSDCTLYVTLEPCVMCAGAIVQARVGRVVYGAADPKAGAVESIYELLSDKRLNHRPQLSRDVLGNECGRILKVFFSELRRNRVK